MKRLIRVVSYLARTTDFRIKVKVTNLDHLNAYFNASFTFYKDMKGVDGILITLGHLGFPVLYKSSKQKPIFHNSTESEFGCLYKGVDILLYIRRLCIFLNIIDTDYTIPVYQDILQLLRWLIWIKDHHIATISSLNSSTSGLKIIWIMVLSSEEMPADLFASPRIGGPFYKRRDIVMQNFD